MRSIAINAWRLGALGLVVLVSAANVIYLPRTTPPAPAASPAEPEDPVLRSERRFAALRTEVQNRGLHGTVGYLADCPASRLAEDPHGVEDYYLTQFALAPLVLDGAAEHHEWIVANLRRSTPASRVPHDWRIVKDFGAGVLLLRRALP